MRHISDYGPAPLDDPGVYPGTWPVGAVLVTGADVTPVPRRADTSGRTPVLAVGSNACPAQLHRKRLDGPVLLTPTVLRNHLVVHAGHVTSYGAVPATVVRWPGAACEVFLSWLTPAQHIQMDTSEDGNYDRVLLPTTEGMVPGYRARTGLFRHLGRVVPLATVRSTGAGMPPAMTQLEILQLVHQAG